MRTAIVITALLSLTLLATANDNFDELRRGGQPSVDKLIAENAPDDLLDRVCAQKDCRASRLFWFTDLEEAKSAARATRRPILALYMLGRLDEELSCANSRFFRVMLYSDPAIASVLRDQYVLYWHSVRPVPRVTIDMGDGRRIQQTITGNSVHYLLDADGNVLDALPGLSSPRTFREQLDEWLKLDRANLRTYHAGRMYPSVRVQAVSRAAVDVSRLAITKSAVERPLVRQLTIGSRPAQVESIDDGNEVEFSPESLALMRTKQPLTGELMNNLRRAVAADTAFNFELHGTIHGWFARDEVKDLDSLNERVYAELFLTPSDDPWLGLNPSSVFTAISRSAAAN